MGARYPAVIELNVSIHSPIRVQIPDAFGPQVRSDRPNRHGFSFNGGRGKDDMDGRIAMLEAVEGMKKAKKEKKVHLMMVINLKNVRQ
jgi:hypothetical protein